MACQCIPPFLFINSVLGQSSITKVSKTKRCCKPSNTLFILEQLRIAKYCMEDEHARNTFSSSLRFSMLSSPLITSAIKHQKPPCVAHDLAKLCRLFQFPLNCLFYHNENRGRMKTLDYMFPYLYLPLILHSSTF